MNVPHPVLLHLLNISMELSSCVQSSERLKKKKQSIKRLFFFPLNCANYMCGTQKLDNDLPIG